MRILLVMAQSLDGKIARDSMDPIDWTEPEDKGHFAELTRKIGLVLMGSRTFERMGKALAGRKNIVLTHSPEKKPPSTEDLLFTDLPIPGLIRKLEDEGYSELALMGGREVNGAFARLNLIDEIYLTLSPLLFGKGLSLFPEDIAMELTLLSVRPLGKNSLLLHYAVEK
ncbi:dihydrofolate reductase family protein [Desulfococcaceae bacterium OttesenSCG-928-F15]|nr:dihydrofolate reductase family protein [Desulfococcaceae bacterium OttesenSCG-928-F15]